MHRAGQDLDDVEGIEECIGNCCSESTCQDFSGNLLGTGGCQRGSLPVTLLSPVSFLYAAKSHRIRQEKGDHFAASLPKPAMVRSAGEARAEWAE